MKQALTTGGQLSVWYTSAQNALEKMGVSELTSDVEVPSISGVHPDFGPVEVVFLVPEEGKTRMEIAYSDAQLLSDFKKTVIPEYKSLLKCLAEKPVEQPEPEAAPQSEEEASTEASEAAVDTQDKAPEDAEQTEQPEEAEVDSQETVAVDDQPQQTVEEWGFVKPETQDTESSEKSDVQPIIEPTESKPAQTEKKAQPKKSKGKMIGIIIAAILVFAIAAGALVYFFVLKPKNNSNNNNNNPINNEQQQEGLITVEQYDKIQNGMTYADVVNAFGGKEGTLLNEPSTFTNENGETVEMKIYWWGAQGESGANAAITFQGDAVVTKTSYGLVQPTE